MRSDPAQAVFFPGEVARLLRLDGIDYAQLRQLYVLARVLRGEPTPGRQWARFSLADLAATEVLVSLGGGRHALTRGRRLVLGEIEATCAALTAMGFDNPLLQVPMTRDGRRILARVGAYILEPATGQLVLATVDASIEAFLAERLITDAKVRSAIRAERNRVRPTRRRRLLADGGVGTLGGVIAAK